jgi:Icc protein
MKLGWLSDIHLNFLDEAAARQFVAGLSSHDADAWIVSGDIGQADSVCKFLRSFAAFLRGKTYFTLGNHDFYGGSLAEVREEVRRLTKVAPQLVWLTEANPQFLDGAVALVGDDSWADARFGNARGTPVVLNDFCLIEELSGLTRANLVGTLNELGDAAAVRLAPKLERAAASSVCVVLATHVPPFREAAWHRGRLSDDDWAPWFSCRAVGETVLRCARSHPEVSFLVLCGHTHGSGVYSPVENVTVRTAEAEYGEPRVQYVFEVKPRTQGRLV